MSINLNCVIERHCKVKRLEIVPCILLFVGLNSVQKSFHVLMPIKFLIQKLFLPRPVLKKVKTTGTKPLFPCVFGIL